MQASIYYRVAARFARWYKMPLGLIVHDDPEGLEGVRWWNKPLVDAGNRSVYRLARERFCISPEMERALHKRYGVAGSVLYPNRSSNLTARPASMNAGLRNPSRLTIGYAGSLVYGYRQGIEKLLPILRQTGSTLRIYSLHKPQFEYGSEVEYAGGFATPEEVWRRVQAECDAVILPYCDREDGHVLVYRTHFPSKLTEYLGLGLPVIVSGPDYATGAIWAARNPQACVLLRSEERDKFGKILARLREDADWRTSLAAGALGAAGGKFDPEVIREKFQKRLFELNSVMST
jgi:glycosyltransferase involved in cell wall biosynthesis